MYTEAIEKARHVRGSDQSELHLKKLNVFMEQSLETLHKHFKRWLSPKLLPAALMSESPTAKLVVAVMLKRDMPALGTAQLTQGMGRHYFKSEAHDRMICIERFNEFLRANIEDAVECSQESAQAAKLVLADVDFRNKDYTEESDSVDIRLHMHSTCLPLASQTQFVESGVKEAKEMSPTD